MSSPVIGLLSSRPRNSKCASRHLLPEAMTKESIWSQWVSGSLVNRSHHYYWTWDMIKQKELGLINTKWKLENLWVSEILFLTCEIKRMEDRVVDPLPKITMSYRRVRRGSLVRIWWALFLTKYVGNGRLKTSTSMCGIKQFMPRSNQEGGQIETGTTMKARVWMEIEGTVHSWWIDGRWHFQTKVSSAGSFVR